VRSASAFKWASTPRSGELSSISFMATRMPASPSRSKSACMKRRNSGISISNHSSKAAANPGVFSVTTS
jgi:hypothetical protein